MDTWEKFLEYAPPQGPPIFNIIRYCWYYHLFPVGCAVVERAHRTPSNVVREHFHFGLCGARLVGHA